MRADGAFDRDQLTGLASRGTLMGHLQGELRRGGRPALLYVDLDDFKLVNDTFGDAAETVAHCARTWS